MSERDELLRALLAERFASAGPRSPGTTTSAGGLPARQRRQEPHQRSAGVRRNHHGETR